MTVLSVILIVNINYFFFIIFFYFFFNDTATTEIYTLSLQRRSSDLQPKGNQVHIPEPGSVTVWEPRLLRGNTNRA